MARLTRLAVVALLLSLSSYAWAESHPKVPEEVRKSIDDTVKKHKQQLDGFRERKVSEGNVMRWLRRHVPEAARDITRKRSGDKLAKQRHLKTWVRNMDSHQEMEKRDPKKARKFVEALRWRYQNKHIMEQYADEFLVPYDGN